MGVRILTVLLAAGLAAAPVLAGPSKHDHQLVVHAAPQDVAEVAASLGLTLVGEIDYTEGYSALLEAPSPAEAAEAVDQLRLDTRMKSVEPAALATLPGTSGVAPDMDELSGDLSQVGDFTTPCLSRHFGSLLWSGYADQDAVGTIRLHEAHLHEDNCGAGAVVAVIDTGIDPDHPLFAGALVGGFDFLLGEAGVPSEWTSLDQSVSAILEQSVSAILEESETIVLAGGGSFQALGSVGPILDQSVSAILEQDPPPAFFGHGTMVSGLVRLTAPGARIMPLKVFDSAGSANIFDIVRAVYYAVDNGAHVINMSFSMPEPSKELQRAIQYARKNGVICVASAGNQSELAKVYPAAWGDTISVAAVDDADALAAFSNYGSGLVDVAAPGSGVVSAYPGDLYGAGWGTSFSTPMVAGTAAVLHNVLPGADTATYHSVLTAIYEGSALVEDLEGLIGSGRLDTLGALEAAQE